MGMRRDCQGIGLDACAATITASVYSKEEGKNGNDND